MTKSSKLAPCPGCLPARSPEEVASGVRQGRASFRASCATGEGLEAGSPCWTCSNCGHELPRAVRAPRPDPAALTRAQAEALDSFKERCMSMKGAADGGSEFKEVRVHLSRWFASAYLVLGRKGDEGTAAEVFCRYTWHVAIGVGGGIRPISWRGPKNREPRGTFAVANWGTEWDPEHPAPVRRRRKGAVA